MLLKCTKLELGFQKTLRTKEPFSVRDTRSDKATAGTAASPLQNLPLQRLKLEE